MKISLIGTGNVAWHIGYKLYNAGHEILEVYGRNADNANLLANKLGAKVVYSFEEINHTAADIILIAVADAGIESIVHAVNLQNKLLIHTSGSTNISAIITKNNFAGVLYPLQTFSKHKEVAWDFPVFLEAENEATLGVLTQLAKDVVGAENVQMANSAQRMALHIAAVIACNFANALYAIADDLLVNNGLKFDYLKPLILETANKVQTLSPTQAQTGPAVRKDFVTIKKHQAFLVNDKNIADIYTILSADIIKRAAK